jgi:hypothetical protein
VGKTTGDNNMSKRTKKFGDLRKMSVNHSKPKGDNNMSTGTNKFGDPQKMSVDHSEPKGDNMSVKNESGDWNETVTYSKLNSNGKLLELETDLSGMVQENKNVVQIKLWEIKDQGLILKGTMTFHFYELNYMYSGILNNSNSEMLSNLWWETGITEFVVEEIDNEYFVDVFWIKYMFTDYRTEYLKFAKDNPEYRNLKLIG